jgi:SAM-dependent methyltransferase
MAPESSPHGTQAPGTQAAEVRRIEAAYAARDASDASSPYRYSNPGYALYMQLLESSLLRSLRRAPVALEGASVLDVGCGSGYFLNRLREFGAGTATGVDLIPERVETARTRYPALRFECANAAELPFADGEFDVVTQFTCLSSVLDPALRAAIGAEMWRVTRGGGIVVSYDMRPPPAPVRAMRWLGDWRRGELGRGNGAATPTTGISAAELERLFPSGSRQYSSVGLAFGLCAVAARSPLSAQLLARVPALREHGIGVVAKPRGSAV